MNEMTLEREIEKTARRLIELLDERTCDHSYQQHAAGKDCAGCAVINRAEEALIDLANHHLAWQVYPVVYLEQMADDDTMAGDTGMYDEVLDVDVALKVVAKLSGWAAAHVS